MLGRRKSEVGSWKTDDGSGKHEVGRQKTEDGSRKTSNKLRHPKRSRRKQATSN